MKRLHDGDYRTPDRITFGDYLVERWLPTKQSQLRPSTFSSYKKSGHAVVAALRRSNPSALDATITGDRYVLGEPWQRPGDNGLRHPTPPDRFGGTESSPGDRPHYNPCETCAPTGTTPAGGTTRPRYASVRGPARRTAPRDSSHRSTVEHVSR